MLLRKNVLPRSLSDTLVTVFTLCIIPTVYYFELFVVLPHFYPQWDFWYTFHFLSGTFILFNLCANYVAIVLCDTSIRGRILPTTMGPNCRFCTVCECIAPPRSWHCHTCNVCILKRDHHCMFTSCCIGHHNLRYFIVFVFYIFVATVYASYYNLFFVLEFAEFGTFESIIKLVFPLATLFVDYSRNQMYLFLVLIVLIGGVFTGVLLYFHGDLILRGVVTHERNQKMGLYDLGRRKNVEGALGDRWCLVWLSPFIESKLPHDGVNWDAKQTPKAK
ncbi:probable palmitoyltransferase ZDHHC24 [Tribolium madens]|uniref:probable palmitoyltransferase ZDHHC24 n=1 Tax=Tribolium madens TaxID=41895 RepID=UPI001CF72BF6|nr:probable palmitoyltransferase ZDHHC24 [Tribolium madens]